MGLNETQIEIIRTATKKRHYYLVSPEGRRLFDLGLGPIALSFAGVSSKEQIAHLDRLAQREGDRWPFAWLDEQGVDYAALAVTGGRPCADLPDRLRRRPLSRARVAAPPPAHGAMGRRLRELLHHVDAASAIRQGGAVAGDAAAAVSDAAPAIRQHDHEHRGAAAGRSGARCSRTSCGCRRFPMPPRCSPATPVR